MASPMSNSDPQVMASAKKMKPGKKRRAAVKAARLRQDNGHQPTTEVREREELEGRPQKRTKLSHVESGEGIMSSQAAPLSAQHVEENIVHQRNRSETATALTSATGILSSHEIVSFPVVSSSEIKRNVTRILSYLSKFSFVDLNAKPVMVEVNANGAAVSKAISIVEITKSELAKQGAKWYQYSTVTPHTVQLPRQCKQVNPPKGRTVAEWEQAKGSRSTGVGRSAGQMVPEGEEGDGDKEVDMHDDDDGDEDAFEPMPMSMGAKPDPEKQKIRVIPRLTIMLSRVRCERWKTLYGSVFPRSRT